ncbi:glycoside hydrolase family 13 protein [Botrimarina mediterranea]|uniref:Neopullulanase 2 n=1 Tax=Botrimarina mediterranea TaxID=2528022 RepID=A0A518K5U0_9BACT|nr:glycoside hydrolase family 13 protein [Botrimarina mediterranea]QDV73164.1 Neopullulanase 2 [Botrimarina mediterranea]QDV77737.1 Neopullulanase 2 [Planctomycetes bacterium K2D]
MSGSRRHTLVTAVVWLLGGGLSGGEEPAVPEWAGAAVWYQVFPERFANGDPGNDPTRASLESSRRTPDSWAVTPWTSDWYGRAEWEREATDDFYGTVFSRRYGGDLQGVIDRLDYLQRLGVNAIYFNPVFAAASLHKYDGNSFHHIDPHFGPDPAGDAKAIEQETDDPATWTWTAADKLFLELLGECQRRQIRVVIDGVFNHTGRGFFAFRDIREQGAESRYRDWYVIDSFDDPTTPEDEFRYRGWWGTQSLPLFADNELGNDLAAGPKAYVLAATRRWMDPNGDGDPADGVDGWRLDVAEDVPIGFWREWNAEVRRLNPEAITVAEHWGDAAGFLADAGFTGVMNYQGFALPVKGFVIDDELQPSEFASLLIERANTYGDAQRHALWNLIDSHDTERVASMIVNAEERLPYSQPDRFDYDAGEKATPRRWEAYDTGKPTPRDQRLQRIVAVLQATCVGAPMIYYGDEAGMWGADDPDCRKPMMWPDLQYDDETKPRRSAGQRGDAVAFDRDLYLFYRHALAMRRLFPVLTRGAFAVVGVDDAASVLVFSRSEEGQSIIVAVNRGEGPWSGDVDLPPGKTLREVFTASGQPYRVRVDATPGGVRLTLPEREAAVFLVEERRDR